VEVKILIADPGVRACLAPGSPEASPVHSSPWVLRRMAPSGLSGRCASSMPFG
jgi:hypothetical protein